LSALIFHERLTLPQIISAAVLLVGAFLAMRTEPVAMTETAENI
jgi:drug/metabolite transporter (DMT)-like permease